MLVLSHHMVASRWKWSFIKWIWRKISELNWRSIQQIFTVMTKWKPKSITFWTDKKFKSWRANTLMVSRPNQTWITNQVWRFKQLSWTVTPVSNSIALSLLLKMDIQWWSNMLLLSSQTQELWLLRKSSNRSKVRKVLTRWKRNKAKSLPSMRRSIKRKENPHLQMEVKPIRTRRNLRAKRSRCKRPWL